MMELQLVLFSLGMLAIAGVWGFNKWQEQKLRKQLQNAFSRRDAEQPDALLAGMKSGTPAYQRAENFQSFAPQIAEELELPEAAPYPFNSIEPAFAQPIAQPFVEAEHTSQVELVDADAALNVPNSVNSANTPTTERVQQTVGILNPLIDCIVHALPARTVSGDHLIVLAQRFRHAGAKPVLMEGLLDTGAVAYWSSPHPGNVYRELRIGVLMANRSGALNAIEFSDFVQIIDRLGEDLDFLPTYPDMQTVLATAQALDQVCARVDIQMSLNVVIPNHTFNLAALQSLLESIGCLLRPDGKYAWLDEAGRVLFVVVVNMLAPQFSFQLDLPRVSADGLPFARMTEKAKALAARVEGVLTDDNQQALSESALQKIGQQLEVLYAEMEQAGVPAGSALAMRLFT